MAVQYKPTRLVEKPDAAKTEFLYKAACAIQTYLDDQAGGETILCVRFSNGAEDRDNDIIVCSSHKNEKAALEYLRDLEPPSEQKVLDYMLGTADDFIEALTWPA